MSLDAIFQRAAKAQVKLITHNYGYLDEYVLGKINPEARQMVERSLIKDRDLKRRVDALATNLENGNSRFSHFVFDLLRNVDDNSFAEARSRLEIPFVTFKLTPSCITLDCNEDGFTPEDVTALCNVGKSSRIGSGLYFSNEGIGFKSVFKVAYRAHIQSGHYSFSFNHKPGQSGMGMISPTWEEHQDKPPVGITRMKLFFHSEKAHSIALQQLGEVEAAHLMFLRNIRRINIIRVDDRDKIISSIKFSFSQCTRNAICLKEENGVEKEKHKYHVIKYLAHWISPHMNRTSPRIDTEPKRASSEVVLAFPLEGVEKEVVSNQQVFAFSAIGKMGFKFLIQADFTIMDKSNDIDVSSKRNQELLEQISIAFVQAMLQLDENADLRHEWMKYLPQTYDVPPIQKGYWTDLRHRIKDRMKTARLNRQLDGVTVSEIERFKRLPPQVMDGEKNPIFAVPFPVTRPSTDYSESNLDLLTEYGLDFLSSAKNITGVLNDLKKDDSRMKSPATSEQWHTVAADLLIYILRSAETNLTKDIKELELIPLANGTWVRVCDVVTPLCFTSIDGIAIPEDLPLTLISPLATRNSARVALFTELGAKQLTISDIRQCIFDRYPANEVLSPVPGETGLTKDISIKHLRFLYLTRDQGKIKMKDFRRLLVFTEGSALKRPALEDVYLFNHGPNKYRTKRYSMLVASLDVDRLSSCYYTAEWQQEVSWVNWLRTAIGIHTRLKLIDKNGPTPILRKLMSHKSDILLGVLQSQWPEIDLAIETYPYLRLEIADALVPCRGRLIELSETYLPLPKLVISSSAFLPPANSFPFLDLSDTLAPTDLSAWEFLYDNFGLNDDNDEIFYLDILRTIARDDHDERIAAPARTFVLYELLYQKIGGAAADEKTLEYIRAVFESAETPLILLPVSGSATQRWKDIEDCRWDGPRNMRSVSGLQSHYRAVYDHDTLMTVIRPFMREVVGVANLSAEDVVEELLLQKEDPSPDSDLIRELYSRLPDLFSAASASDAMLLRRKFRRTPLIFAQDEWHTPDKCVWSREDSAPGKVQLSQYYSGMESTFVDTLGVAIDLNMAYDLVLAVGDSASATIDQAKEALRRFNSGFPFGRNPLDPTQLLRSTVFPVRYPDGSVVLSRADLVDFAIADQHVLSEHRLRGSVEMLDFAPDEVRRLRPLLDWAGLMNRFLSARVLEMTKPLETTALLSDPRRSIQLRAHSLCRIAMHFESPRARDIETLYRILRQSQVFESSPAITELCIVEDGSIVTVDQLESETYLGYTNDKLNIYVPRDTHRQDFCFLFDLPHALSEWFMPESLPRQEHGKTELTKRLIAAVLNSEPQRATWFLDKEGIVTLDAFVEEDDVSAWKARLRRNCRVRLPPVTQAQTVTKESNGGTGMAESEKDKPNADEQQPPIVFSGDGILKTEFCPSTALEALRIGSPSLLGGEYSPFG